MPDWYKARQRACGFGMYGVLGIEREDREKRTAQARKNYELFGAPVGLFISVNKAVGPNGWGHVGHFVQSICLAAVGSGLGTCLQEAWAGFPSLLKKHLNHGDDEIIWCGISMGYEDKNEVINSFVPDREKTTPHTAPVIHALGGSGHRLTPHRQEIRRTRSRLALQLLFEPEFDQSTLSPMPPRSRSRPAPIVDKGWRRYTR